MFDMYLTAGIGQVYIPANKYSPATIEECIKPQVPQRYSKQFLQPYYCAVCTNLAKSKNRFEEFLIKEECINPLPPPTKEQIEE